MTAKNDITGDLIASKAATNAYRDNYDRIFGSKKKVLITAPDPNAEIPMTAEKEQELDKVLDELETEHSKSVPWDERGWKPD